MLDKFDALTNSITEGLPREIKLRQQQYAYYRELLLSFPKNHPTLSGTPPTEGNLNPGLSGTPPAEGNLSLANTGTLQNEKAYSPPLEGWQA